MRLFPRKMQRWRSHPYLLFILMCLFGVSLIWLVPLPDVENVPYSPVITYRDGSIMRVYRSADDGWRIYTPLENIDPLLIQTTICFEDRYFYLHPGVNPVAILRAALANFRAGRIVSGGSTLAMQTARLVHPQPRTLKAKAIESFRALQFVSRMGRKRTLETYFNRTPYGGNIYGVTAASWAYFHHGPEKLTPSEVAVLVALPQAPSTRRPQSDHELELQRARNRILKKMQKCALISPSQYFQALRTRVPIRVYPFPVEAPHAADYARIQSSAKTHRIVTTLDKKIQRLITHLAREYQHAFLQAGASNAAIVVISNDNRAIRALLGSLDYFDVKNQGQVIGFLARRSPGSTLKPFLYGLALDQGVVTPDSLLEDFPTQYPSYQPENFDREYRGLVPAHRALVHSLNIPFVHLLQKTGLHEFIETLNKLALNVARDRSYGLSLVTGAVEVRLIDLTNAYVTLARGGLSGPFNWNNEKLRSEIRVLSPGAVTLIRRALSIRDRPDAPALKLISLMHKPIYWKTGTSWGRRDAWSIGFDDRFTVGVWVGNFSGEGADSIVGAELAAPLMFDILRALEKKGSPSFPREDPNVLQQVEVCAFSGYLPGPACSHTRLAWIPKDAPLHFTCPYHRNFWMEISTGKISCPLKTYPMGSIRRISSLVLPPLAVKWMHLPNEPFINPDSGCSPMDESPSIQSVKILHPMNNATYVLTSGLRTSGNLPLQAFSTSQPIYWFINDRFIGESSSGQTLHIPIEPGQFRIIAITQDGLKSIVQINVQ